MNNDELKYLIIYHKEDNDGVFSAAISMKYLINELNIDRKNIDLLPSTYNTINIIDEEKIDEWQETYSHILMLDISISSCEKMNYIYKLYGNNFIWCDHHAPIIKDSEDWDFKNCPGNRYTFTSALMCTYIYFYDPFLLDYNFNKEKIPELYRILAAWDSFTYKENGYDFDYVYEINKAVTITYDLNVDTVYDLIQYVDTNGILANLQSTGKIIHNYEKVLYKNMIDNYGDLRWTVDGQPACAIFMQGCTNSTYFETLKNTEFVRGIAFKKSQGDRWTLSLYNINENDSFHCGKYLRDKYGGGGHAGAAGCSIDKNTFIDMLSTHKV